jgi:Fe-S oxidoreductase
MPGDVRFVSFFQFILEHIDSPGLERNPALGHTSPPAPADTNSKTARTKVTLHEPCKTAYTGFDTSHRELIKRLPGVDLHEMESGATCCGSGGLSWYREKTLDTITLPRLEEARKTGAEKLITVCHFCQEIFEGINEHEGLDIVNLADLLFDNLMRSTAKKTVYDGDMSSGPK